MENHKTTEIIFLERVLSLFKRKKNIRVGDLGIYHEMLNFTTIANIHNAVSYDVFIKVKVLEVYDNLVEVEVLDVNISSSVSEDVSNFVKHESIKYLKPKDVKWKIKEC